MAYGLRYQSDSYNYFGTLVSVKIYQKDYSASVEDDIRVQSVTIIANYQNDNTPIIGLGAKIVMVADSLDLAYLRDLLLSYERQFLCVIEYNGVVVFRGYSICDLNERQLLPYALITIEFTDYLRRLDGKYPDVLKTIASNTSVFDLVQEMLSLTTLDFPLYINSTLFEDSMTSGVTDTFLPQVYVQNANFYSNSYDYDNIYDAINKTLQPFGAFLYSFEDKWIIERQEDITRDGNWVLYSSAVGSEVASLKKTIYKQGSDGENFEYVNTEQIIEYDSGLHTLILSLKDKKLDSLVFNDYTTDIDTISDETPEEADALDDRKWYAHTNLTGISTGKNYNGVLNTWIRYTSAELDEGLYYNFIIQFNGTAESSGGAVDTSLYVSYHMSTGLSLDNIYYTKIRFLLRLVGGDYSDYWITVGGNISGKTTLYLYPPSGGDFSYRSADPGTWLTSYTIVDVTNHDTYDWSIFKSFNLTDMQCIVYRPTSGYVVFDSLWEALGYPTYQEMCIMFLPCAYSDDINHTNPTVILPDNFLGDITVQVSVEDIDNRIEYHLNENFVKTDEIDLYLFDLDNLNYSNGLLGSDRTTLTNLWTSENSVTPCPLYEVFAKGKFRKYGRTIHRLKGKILIDQHLKPFTLIQDDTITNESDASITFLLNGYTWNLNEGTYDIEAEEYTEEEITIDGVTYDSTGEPIVNVPSTPTGLVVVRFTYFGANFIVWNPISGIMGYKLQRKPFYSTLASAWVDTYIIVYNGTASRFSDAVASEGGNPVGQTFSYRVCAYNSAGDSVYSDPVTVTWS